MQLGSSMRRRRGRGDGEPAGPSWPPEGGFDHPDARARVVAIAAALVVFGVGGGWLLATRVLFPPPPPPGDLYAVPDLYDKELAEATRLIEEAGLTLGNVDHFRHPSVDSGSVLGQDPLPGQLAMPGRAVQLTVSEGGDRRAVPEVSQLRGDRAFERLEASGFVVLLDSVQSDDPRGHVVSVDPPEGTMLAVPAEVHLRVSVGPPQVGMPSLLGMAENIARDTLQALGFSLTAMEQTNALPEQEGKVVGQDPSPGQMLERGASVRIVIARSAAKPDTVPGG